MFEQPWALALLLLAVPWIFWARRREPRRWPVGGLDPFRKFAARGGSRRRMPPSLLLGLAALAAAAAAVANPRREGLAPVVLVDASFSAQALNAPDAMELGVVPRLLHEWQKVPVGDTRSVVREAQLFEALRLHGGGRRSYVITDRMVPLGLPANVRWLRGEFALRRGPGLNAAILNVVREDGACRVHWANWGVPQPLRLMAVGDGAERVVAELAGEGGALLVEDCGSGQTLQLRSQDGKSLGDDQPLDDSWRLAESASVVVPEDADPRWAAAVQAAWPGAVLVRAGAGQQTAGTVLVLDFAGGPGTLSFPGDPFARLTELEAVAEIAAALAPLRDQVEQAPRPRAECEPQATPGEWSGELPGPLVFQCYAWQCAAAGLALYVASLVALRLGH